MLSIFPDGDLDNAVELGAIDDRSVRLWLRFAGRERVSARLETPGQPPVVEEITLSPANDWTTGHVLSLPNPAPGAPFTVVVEHQRRSANFAPTPGTAASLTFGFGSCQMPFAESDDGQVIVRDDAAAIYPAIRNDLQRAGGQLFLFTGDQIYSDGLKPFSVLTYPTDGGAAGASTDGLLARYRAIYRGFFNQPGIRHLRETFPTLCMWDDHEIFDNWGSTAGKSPADLHLFAAASRAFGDYQHAKNPSGGASVAPFQWLTRWGDIAIVALDLRGARDYASGTMLGKQQSEWLHALLSGDGLRYITTLFVMSSVPVTHTARWFTRLFDFMPKQFAGPIRDRWSSSGFIASRNELLDALFGWEASERNRQVIILSGDVHCASSFTIRKRNGPGVIHQVTSSAMTTPMVLKQIIFNRTVVHGANLLERQYRFTRNFLSITHNYGGVRVEPLPGGGHRIIIAIRSWNPKRRQLRTTGRLVVQPAGT